MERDDPLIAVLKRERSPLDADKKVAGVNRRRRRRRRRRPLQKQSKNITFTRVALA